MKSSRPGVGPLEVLEHEHRRAPLAAMRSKKVRHAANSSLAPAGRRRSTPSSVEQRRLDPARARSSSGTYSATRRGDRARVVASSSLSAGRPAADHLAQRPEGDALAVGGRAAAVPVDVLDHAVDVLLELPRQAALADARRAR